LLAGKLSQLVRQSLEILEAKRSEAKPTKMILVRHKITNFHIDEKGSGWQATDEPFERVDWSTFLFDLVRDQIATLPIFNETVEIILQNYGEVLQSLSADINKKSQVEFWLGNFVRRVLNEKLENGLSEDRLIELITIFENELNCSPMENRIISYISGLYLKTDSALLDENTYIRKLVASDLEYEYFFSAPPMSPRHQMRNPSAVVEIRMRVKDQSELWKKLETTLLILRLFRLGSIHSLWNEHTKESVMWPSGTSSTWSHSSFTELQKYTVEENEVQTLKKFFKSLEPLVHKETAESSSLSVAIRRYSNALLDPVDTDRKLMTAMMGLESLYSVPSDKGEIAYRLGLRIAKLLSYLGFKPIEVRNNVEKAYFVRNKVAHGLIVDIKKIGNVAELLNALLQYLRISLIVFIFVGSQQKNRFVTLIDHSLIDVTSSMEIQNKIKEIEEHIPILLT